MTVPTQRFALGAVIALALTGVGLWVRERRRRERGPLGGEPPSRTAEVAALGSVGVALSVVALLGGLLASATLPVTPAAGLDHRAMTVSNHVFTPAALLLFVVPVLGTVALLFGAAAEETPRGFGTLPVGLVHAFVAALFLGFGRLATSSGAETFCYVLAVAPAVAAVAYVVMFVDYLRTPMSRRP